MDIVVSFIFRSKLYACKAFIDATERPFYIFIILQDADLVAEFGEEISVKTDGVVRLPKADDNKGLVELRQTLFDAIKGLPEYKKLTAPHIH